MKMWASINLIQRCPHFYPRHQTYVSDQFCRFTPIEKVIIGLFIEGVPKL